MFVEAVKNSDSAFPLRRGGPSAIFFVGDSITLGWRDETRGGWPARLLTGLGPAGASVTMYNLGVRGDTSEDIAVRWHDEVVRRRREPRSAVVFAFGVNDAKLSPGGSYALGAARTRSNVASILARATADHTVLFVGPTPVEEAALHRVLNPASKLAMPSNDSIVAVSAIIAGEAERVGVPYLDLFNELTSDPRWIAALRQTDGLHPPAIGHDILARTIAAWRPWTALFEDVTT